jgi:hypothetical protein
MAVKIRLIPKKKEDNSDKFQYWQVKHIVKNAEPFLKWHTFFYTIVAAVFIYKTAPNVTTVAAKAGVVILF